VPVGCGIITLVLFAWFWTGRAYRERPARLAGPIDRRLAGEVAA
jgi:hypothetical protein